MNTSTNTTHDTPAGTPIEGQAETPTSILITEREWKNTRKTDLFGLAKEPFRGRKKIPGYAPILLREDAFAFVKQMASQSATRMVGAKEILTAIVLLAMQENPPPNPDVMPKAKAIVQEDVARELEQAEAEGL